MHQMTQLTARGRTLVVAAAFLGWMCSGVQMSVMYLASRPATREFDASGWFPANSANLPESAAAVEDAAGRKFRIDGLTATWGGYYNAMFLLGAAFGGLVFGWMGDTLGRVRAMASSIFAYSIFGGLGALAPSPETLLLLRFLAGMGVGGMWPTGVSLAAEAMSQVSRPALSGFLGASANIGIVAMYVLGYFIPIGEANWRMMLGVTGVTAMLGVAVLLLVPESEAWKHAKSASRTGQAPARAAVFRPPLLWRTLLGILLGTVPLLGGWGATGWMIFWADKVRPDKPEVKALTGIMRAAGGTIGSLLGGVLANLLGRRATYFGVSLISFAMCQYIFWVLTPESGAFQLWVFAVGFVSTIFFGWLPLYLPELFPTTTRAQGAGVSFNFGRILTAAGILGQGALVYAFHNDFAKAGRLMSCIYAVGMVIIFFAPRVNLINAPPPEKPEAS